MKVIHQFLPYFDERPSGKRIRALVFHCSAHSAKEMVEVLRERELSAHYIIDLDGTIIQLVSEKKRAWHAGQSKWHNLEMLNQYSVGIELSSPTLGQSTYNKEQIKSLIKLSRQIIRHYQIPAANVVGHSDIAPTRKPDPGIAFPWQNLAQHGIGMWYDLADALKEPENNVKILLQKIGYDTTDLAAAGYAFCRRFAPQYVAADNDVNHLLENVFPPDFALPPQILPLLKACAYRYGKNRNFKS